jgi:hypothetical protein
MSVKDSKYGKVEEQFKLFTQEALSNLPFELDIFTVGQPGKSDSEVDVLEWFWEATVTKNVTKSFGEVRASQTVIMGAMVTTSDSSEDQESNRDEIAFIMEKVYDAIVGHTFNFTEIPDVSGIEPVGPSSSAEERFIRLDNRTLSVIHFFEFDWERITLRQ